MLTREQRVAKSAMWLAHWRGWQSSGVSVAEYARREGFDVDAAYRWRRVLRRTGQWIEVDGSTSRSVPAAARKRKRVRFARVAVADAVSAAASSMVLKLLLGNGRRAELEVSGMAHLVELIGVLERTA